MTLRVTHLISTQHICWLLMGIYRPIDPLDHSISEISTPLNITAWERALADHPDKLFVQYLIQGLKNSFRIGFDCTNHFCKPVKKNLLSAQPNPQVVEDCLAKEVIG